MDLSALIKTIADRASLLFGVATAGLVFYFAQRLGLIADAPPLFLHSVYWVAIVAACALAYGLVSSLWRRLRNLLDGNSKRFERGALALKNFAVMLPAHKDTLVFLKAHDTQRFPQEQSSRTLNEMVALGLMDCERTSVYARTVYYRIPDAVWENMKALNWPVGQGVPQYAPWLQADDRY
jgi:hypothetical protein